MKYKQFRKAFLFSAIFIFFFSDCTRHENNFTAYTLRAFSLKNVYEALQNPASLATIQSFAGITRFIGFVLDRDAKDIILVGIKNDAAPPANFDDFIKVINQKIAAGYVPSGSMIYTDTRTICYMQPMLHTSYSISNGLLSK